MRVCAGDGGRWGGLKRQKKKLLKTAMLDLKDSFGRKKKKKPSSAPSEVSHKSTCQSSPVSLLHPWHEVLLPDLYSICV